MSNRVTRHNGRSGAHGTYNEKHNDRNFDVKNSDHIDSSRSNQNVYWDCYQGYYFPASGQKREFTFSDIEKHYYREHYDDHVYAQNERNEKARHSERNRTTEDVHANKNTCPEESVLQIGNIEGTIPAPLFAQICAEYFEEFDKRFGSHVHILNWALHLDEATPHIHERHVFDALNEYGELCPMQDKALEALGFGLPKPDKPKGKYNNRKMTFDAECRRMFIDIARRHGLDIEVEPIYGGRSYLEKADYIVMKLHEENKKLTEENTQLRDENNDLVMKISDVEQLLDDVAADAYGKACDVVAEAVREETQKADIKLIDDYEKTVLQADNSPTVRSIAKKIFAGIRNLFAKAAEKMLGTIKRTLADPGVKAKSIDAIKEKAHGSILEKLAKAKIEVDLENRAHQPGPHSKGKGAR